ncbi:MAG: prepilin-type N-terminal cleavage/methylation domain-containing protein [Candidatus Omnitrophica bacterium]|nr:prepilin-type N-terminal cleavage/methylation domain-containing protein [Candidatus Omnitrophota bacterium]
MVFNMNRGHTLIELMISVGIVVALLVAALGIFTMSNTSWRVGMHQSAEQREARKGMDRIAQALRQSCRQWTAGGIYGVNISNANQQIDFYVPVLDATGNITTLRLATFRIDPNNSQQLLYQEGTDAELVVANYVSAVSFRAGCATCATYTCTTPAADCPIILVTISTSDRPASDRNRLPFTLTSRVMLRNYDTTLTNNPVIETH